MKITKFILFAALVGSSEAIRINHREAPVAVETEKAEDDANAKNAAKTSEPEVEPKSTEELKEEEDKAVEKAVKSKKSEEKAAVTTADANNLKDAMKEDKAEREDSKKTAEVVEEIKDKVT